MALADLPFNRVEGEQGVLRKNCPANAFVEWALKLGFLELAARTAQPRHPARRSGANRQKASTSALAILRDACAYLPWASPIPPQILAGNLAMGTGDAQQSRTVAACRSFESGNDWR